MCMCVLVHACVVQVLCRLGFSLTASLPIYLLAKTQQCLLFALSSVCPPLISFLLTFSFYSSHPILLLRYPLSLSTTIISALLETLPLLIHKQHTPHTIGFHRHRSMIQSPACTHARALFPCLCTLLPCLPSPLFLPATSARQFPTLAGIKWRLQPFVFCYVQIVGTLTRL